MSQGEPDRAFYPRDSAMALIASAKQGKVDRSTWSSTRPRTLRR